MNVTQNRCCVPYCSGEGSEKYQGILFNLTSCEKLLETWKTKIKDLDKILLEHSASDLRICSKHFRDGHIVKTALGCRLNRFAVPHLALPETDELPESTRPESILAIEEICTSSLDSNTLHCAASNHAKLQHFFNTVQLLDEPTKICINDLLSPTLCKNLTLMDELLKRCDDSTASSTEDMKSVNKLRLFLYFIYKTSPNSYGLLQEVLRLPPVGEMNAITINFKLDGFVKILSEIVSLNYKHQSPTSLNCVLHVHRVPVLCDPFLFSSNKAPVDKCDFFNSAIIIFAKSILDDWEYIVYYKFHIHLDVVMILKILADTEADLAKLGTKVEAVVLPHDWSHMLNNDTFHEFALNHFYIFDIEHLLKVFLSHIVATDMEGNILFDICGKYLKELYIIDKDEPIRLAPNLTQNHITAEMCRTLTVAQVLQIFQRDVRAALNVYIRMGIIKDKTNIEICIDFLETFHSIFKKLSDVDYRVDLCYNFELISELLNRSNNVSQEVAKILKDIHFMMRSVCSFHQYLFKKDAYCKEKYNNNCLYFSSLKHLETLNSLLIHETYVIETKLKQIVCEIVIQSLLKNNMFYDDRDEFLTFINLCKKLESLAALDIVI